MQDNTRRVYEYLFVKYKSSTTFRGYRRPFDATNNPYRSQLDISFEIDVANNDASANPDNETSF